MIFFVIKNGWLSLTKQCISDCIEQGWDKEILLCKQNYGALHFRISSSNSKIINIIKGWEKISLNTCEACGNSVGVIQTKGWVMSLCPICVTKEKEIWKASKDVPPSREICYKKKNSYKKKLKKPTPPPTKIIREGGNPNKK